MKRCIALLLVLGLAGCALNYHVKPKEACPTAGASPLASNCPTPDEFGRAH